MPCLLGLLAVAFPRVAIILLWLFSSFFAGVYNNVIVPVLGFLFLPLTLIVYTYLLKTYGGPVGTHQGILPFGTPQLIILFIAVILDLGLVGGGTFRQRRR